MSRSDITAKAWTADHDIALMERVLGTPERADRLLLYVRDAEGYLCTWPLDGGAEADAGELVGAMALASSRELERLHIWGPAVAGGKELAELKMWYVRPVRDFDCLMRVPLDIAELGVPAKRGNKGRRRFHATTVDGFPGASVLSPFVESYLDRTDVPALQKAIIGLASDADLYRGSVCHVGMADEGPAGVVVSHRLATGVVVVRWALFTRNAKGVSDFLFRHVARYHRERSVSILDLGYGGSPTLFAYKRKLGAQPLGRPILRWGVHLR